MIYKSYQSNWSRRSDYYLLFCTRWKENFLLGAPLCFQLHDPGSHMGLSDQKALCLWSHSMPSRDMLSIVIPLYQRQLISGHLDEFKVLQQLYKK